MTHSINFIPPPFDPGTCLARPCPAGLIKAVGNRPISPFLQHAAQTTTHLSPGLLLAEATGCRRPDHCVQCALSGIRIPRRKPRQNRRRMFPLVQSHATTSSNRLVFPHLEGTASTPREEPALSPSVRLRTPTPEMQTDGSCGHGQAGSPGSDAGKTIASNRKPRSVIPLNHFTKRNAFVNQGALLRAIQVT
jgi:hypothetical protein